MQSLGNKRFKLECSDGNSVKVRPKCSLSLYYGRRRKTPKRWSLGRKEKKTEKIDNMIVTSKYLRMC